MKKNKKIEAMLLKNEVIVDDNKKAAKLVRKGFGSIKNNELVLSLFEALYLLEKEKIEIKEKGKNIGKERICEISKDENFPRKYAVYRDLRERGYVLKSGLKFGADFRVYERGRFENEEHSSYLLHIFKENDTLSLAEIAGKIRLATSVRKKAIFAVVDDEGDISYYLASRMLP